MKTILNERDVIFAFQCPRCGAALTRSTLEIRQDGIPVCACGWRTILAYVAVETETGPGVSRKPPDVSFAQYAWWKSEHGTDLSYEDWAAWRRAGNGED